MWHIVDFYLSFVTGQNKKRDVGQIPRLFGEMSLFDMYSNIILNNLPVKLFQTYYLLSSISHFLLHFLKGMDEL